MPTNSQPFTGVQILDTARRFAARKEREAAEVRLGKATVANLAAGLDIKLEKVYLGMPGSSLRSEIVAGFEPMARALFASSGPMRSEFKQADLFWAWLQQELLTYRGTEA